MYLQYIVSDLRNLWAVMCIYFPAVPASACWKNINNLFIQSSLFGKDTSLKIYMFFICALNKNVTAYLSQGLFRNAFMHQFNNQTFREKKNLKNYVCTMAFDKCMYSELFEKLRSKLAAIIVRILPWVYQE